VQVQGTDILVNGEPVFLRGISIHEQAPMREGRACSEADARQLLGWAQELGANAVVGVDLDYEVLGQGNGMLMVSASGTAVVVE
jgi:uncharacterized protein YbjQ (UPF0145 family)